MAMRLTVLLLILHVSTVHAQGWRLETTTDLDHTKYLAVESQERNAELDVWCGPMASVEVLGHRGIFDYSVITGYVSMRARFLPESIIVPMTWGAHVSSGEAYVAD